MRDDRCEAESDFPVDAGRSIPFVAEGLDVSGDDAVPTICQDAVGVDHPQVALVFRDGVLGQTDNLVSPRSAIPERPVKGPLPPGLPMDCCIGQESCGSGCWLGDECDWKHIQVAEESSGMEEPVQPRSNEGVAQSPNPCAFGQVRSHGRGEARLAPREEDGEGNEDWKQLQEQLGTTTGEYGFDHRGTGRGRGGSRSRVGVRRHV
mmetsp:Transcript_289/g.626  ORF Transcript_289/g.626 Transcript_289/m.626 type:complete len:206 (+) Transcript_289:968-1585(+)